MSATTTTNENEKKDNSCCSSCSSCSSSRLVKYDESGTPTKSAEERKVIYAFFCDSSATLNGTPWRYAADDTDQRHFHGGCVEGMAQHLKHLQMLGVTHLLSTPIFLGLDRHGYTILDMHRFDKRLICGANIAEPSLVTFSTKEEALAWIKRRIEIPDLIDSAIAKGKTLADLINDPTTHPDTRSILEDVLYFKTHIYEPCSANGISLLSDFVPNHWSEKHPLYLFHKAHPDCEDFAKGWFQKDENDDQLYFMNYTHIVKLDLDYPDEFGCGNEEEKTTNNDVPVPLLYQLLLSSGRTLLRAGVSGFRIDHATGPSLAYHKRWCNDIRKDAALLNKSVYIIGEVNVEVCFYHYYLFFLKFKKKEFSKRSY